MFLLLWYIGLFSLMNGSVQKFEIFNGEIPPEQDFVGYITEHSVESAAEADSLVSGKHQGEPIHFSIVGILLEVDQQNLGSATLCFEDRKGTPFQAILYHANFEYFPALRSPLGADEFLQEITLDLFFPYQLVLRSTIPGIYTIYNIRKC
jgi:hypothetical protein